MNQNLKKNKKFLKGSSTCKKISDGFSFDILPWVVLNT